VTTGYSSLTKEQARREIRELDAFYKKKMSSKKTAHQFLVDAGIVTPKGKVSKRYQD